MAASAEAPLAGRYRLLRRLGSGGVATVYLAEDERLGRRVAVKRLHAHGSEDTAQRFEREARIGAALNHPNLVAVYDVTADHEQVVIVMEYVEGATLADAIREEPLERERVLEILRGAAAGLDHAHAQGVVHRDVKPANVLLGRDGRVKVADLGIAIAAEATHITRTGTVLGTPSYMAPEQLEGATAGPAADVYALATLGFEALAGRKARQGRTALEVAHRVASEPAPDVREAWPEAPPAVAEALCAGMAADPADRPGSAGELVERLSAAMAELRPGTPAGQAGDRSAASAGPPAVGPEPARPTPAPPSRPSAAGRGSGRSSRGRWAALAAVALLALGVLAAALISGGGDEAAQEAPTDRAEEGQEPEGSASPSGEAPPPSDEAAAPAEEAEAPAGDGASADAPTAPEETVTTFYESSSADDYRAAWALATPSFREQLGGFQAFRQQQSTLESIEFERAEVTEEGEGTAEVAVETVATHTNGVDQCEGTMSLVRGDQEGWLIDGAAITCPESTRTQ